jgi:hypothetical protein
MNEFFSDLSNFWERIAPYIVAHVLALLTLRFMVGLRFNVATRAETFLASERWGKWKKVLDEFELRPKLPFLAVLFVAFYFVLFQTAESLLSQTQIPPLSFRHSEEAFWMDSKPFHDIVELAVLRNDPDDSEIWKLTQFKRTALRELELKYPAAYQSAAGWRAKDSGRWSTYFRLALLFAGFCIVMAIRHRRDRREGRRIVMWRLVVTAAGAFIIAMFARYRAEQSIEHQLRQELYFVTSHLRATTPPSQRLSNQQRAQVEERIYRELARDLPFDYFWLSRLLEPLVPVPRAFPRVHSETFAVQWGRKQFDRQRPGA